MIPDGFYLELNNIYLAEHTGTHLDAPAHFIQGEWRLDQVPLKNLVGPGVVVDVRDKTRDNPDYEIGPEDFQDWEREHGRIPDGSVLMLRTGWGEWYWDQGETAYLGTDTGVTSLLHFPGLKPEGAQWLADNRKMHVIGIDTGSMDNGQSVQKMSHRILLPKRVVFIENVGHLDQLPVTGSTVYAMPIMIGQGSGGPARVFAIAAFVVKEISDKNRKLQRDLLPVLREADLFLQRLDDDVKSEIEKNVPGFQSELSNFCQKLESGDCPILVAGEDSRIICLAGETSAGKSSLLNLLLGEDVLPQSLLSTTHVICELKRDTRKHVVVHSRDGDCDTEFDLVGSVENQKRQLSRYIYSKEKVPKYKKVEIFWPSPILHSHLHICDWRHAAYADLTWYIVFSAIGVLSAAAAVVWGCVSSIRRRAPDQAHAAAPTRNGDGITACSRWPVQDQGNLDESVIGPYAEGGFGDHSSLNESESAFGPYAEGDFGDHNSLNESESSIGPYAEGGFGDHGSLNESESAFGPYAKGDFGDHNSLNESESSIGPYAEGGFGDHNSLNESESAISPYAKGGFDDHDSLNESESAISPYVEGAFMKRYNVVPVSARSEQSPTFFYQERVGGFNLSLVALWVVGQPRVGNKTVGQFGLLLSCDRLLDNPREVKRLLDSFVTLCCRTIDCLATPGAFMKRYNVVPVSARSEQSPTFFYQERVGGFNLSLVALWFLFAVVVRHAVNNPREITRLLESFVVVVMRQVVGQPQLLMPGMDTSNWQSCRKVSVAKCGVGDSGNGDHKYRYDTGAYRYKWTKYPRESSSYKGPFSTVSLSQLLQSCQVCSNIARPIQGGSTQSPLTESRTNIMIVDNDIGCPDSSLVRNPPESVNPSALPCPAPLVEIVNIERDATYNYTASGNIYWERLPQVSCTFPKDSHHSVNITYDTNTTTHSSLPTGNLTVRVVTDLKAEGWVRCKRPENLLGESGTHSLCSNYMGKSSFTFWLETSEPLSFENTTCTAFSENGSHTTVFMAGERAHSDITTLPPTEISLINTTPFSISTTHLRTDISTTLLSTSASDDGYGDLTWYIVWAAIGVLSAAVALVWGCVSCIRRRLRRKAQDQAHAAVPTRNGNGITACSRWPVQDQGNLDESVIGPYAEGGFGDHSSLNESESAISPYAEGDFGDHDSLNESESAISPYAEGDFGDHDSLNESESATSPYAEGDFGVHDNLNESESATSPYAEGDFGDHDNLNESESAISPLNESESAISPYAEGGFAEHPDLCRTHSSQSETVPYGLAKVCAAYTGRGRAQTHPVPSRPYSTERPRRAPKNEGAGLAAYGRDKSNADKSGRNCYQHPSILPNPGATQSSAYQQNANAAQNSCQARCYNSPALATDLERTLPNTYDLHVASETVCDSAESPVTNSYETAASPSS
uniref:Dynamin N-terminal domain-containing protein n=1 Tax=Branchiostoma floridae TaxID=7739 RepID=C3Z9L8_BRAFL|eukprot:XP_002594703.1 hypothetical protein BRAFLDRAFT_101436 [Branchiostoma floridae]